MPKGLEEEFGGILGKKGGDAEETGAASDILAAVKANDAGALKSALKLFLEECGVYAKSEESSEEEDDEE